MEENKKYKLDVVDKKLITSLELNARTPLTKLARAARISRSVAEYRLKQLEQKGIVRGYYPLLDPAKFGLTVWKLWLSIHPRSQHERREFFDYLTNHPQVWWYAECAGIYDAVICVLAKTPHEFNKFITALHHNYGALITNTTTLINVSFEYHTRGFLLNLPSRLIETSFQEKPLERPITAFELNLLNSLSKNARIPLVNLAAKTKKNVKTITKAINSLKKSGVIVYFRPSIDMTRVGYEYYKVLVTLQNPRGGIIPSVIMWCRSNKNINAVITCVGPWQLELEVEIDSFRNICAMLAQLKEAFPEVVKSYEVLLVTHEGNAELDLIDKVQRMHYF